MKFKSVISLFAALLVAVGCGTGPASEGYSVLKADQLEQEGESQEQESEGQEQEDGGVLAEHKNTVIGGVVAVVCAAIPGCRGVVKNGVLKIKDGTGKVIATVKKPFSKLFSKSDEAAKGADEAVETTEQAAKASDQTTDGAQNGS